jgi:4-hydroxy-2-oxoheptanedioate aldolase
MGTFHRKTLVFLVAISAAGLVQPSTAQERANRLIALLEAGKPALGVWTGAIAAPRMAKVLATSDADFIVADVEHDIYDFNALHRFLLEIPDCSNRFRTERRPAPVVLVKLANRGTWDPRYEIAETLKVGPAMGVWVPFVESRADVERALSAVRNAETSALEGLNDPRESRDVWPLNPKGELMLVAMIETDAGARRAEEIIGTPGLSAVQPVHLKDADTARVLKICRSRGVVCATDAGPDDIKARLDEGYRMISVGWDFDIVSRGLGDMFKRMRTAIK